MLPILQIPPHAVTPPPSNFATFASLSGHDIVSASNDHRRERAGLPPRSFPIRTSQPHRRSAASSATLYPPHPDNHLRRKTPNGTVDAGYDGSPTQLSEGPPPLKYLVLPGATRSVRHSASNVPSQQFPHFVSRDSFIARNEDRCFDGVNARAHVGSEGWPLMAQTPVQGELQYERYHPITDLNRQAPYDMALNGMGATPDRYQPYVRANEYNAGAFCPPPIVNNDSLPLGQVALRNAATSPSGFVDVNQLSARSLTHAHGQNFAPKTQGVLFDSPARPFAHQSIHLGVPSHNVQLQHRDGSAPSTYSSPVAQMSPFESTSQGGFREKVLFQAYKGYMDLVGYLQTFKRSNATKTASSPSQRLFVYPKPPRLSMPFPFYGEDLKGSQSNLYHHSADGAYQPSQEQATGASDGSRGGTGQLKTSGGVSGGCDGLDFSLMNTFGSYSTGFLNSSTSPGKMTPLSHAKFSLEILQSLCEQSGWSWIDGMLLGGCLHYGLEHYEEALEWFSRIITLNSSSVEAITNMAATLYCLNRWEDAEKHWLRAVKLRPSYLEAAEHLVGLLYKKRSKEAVEVIDFIQGALRMKSPGLSQSRSSTTTHQTTRDFTNAPQSQNAETYGLGSSGYAVPGKENGRIIALIHAKGTMLYSLKEVDQASKAFEEAVLISAGRQLSGIQNLVSRIQAALSPPRSLQESKDHAMSSSGPLLLPPDKARHTAQLVFGGHGELPGLRYMADGPTKRAAMQTTSNSLLSLAKIFQDAMSSGSPRLSLLHRASSVSDILALYYLSLSLQESPSTANNVGILLAGVQQTSSVLSHSKSDTVPQSSIPGIVPGSGLALALAYYHYGLRLDPRHVHLHTNLGSLLKDIGQLDLAIQMYEQAVSCDGNFDIALTNLANAVKDRGRINDAIVYYKRAVSSNPGFAEAVCGLFTALNSVCDWKGRGGVMLHSGKYDRWHVDEKGLLVDARVQRHGSGLTKRVTDIVRRQLDEASRWGCGVLKESVISALAEHAQLLCSEQSLKPGEKLRAWAGQPWEGSRLIRLVERMTRVAQWSWYRDRYISGGQDPKPYLRPSLHPSVAVPSAPTVLPFHTFTCPLTAKDIRLISQRNALRISCSTLRLPWIPTTVYPPPPPPAPHLNVGYLSSDFNNHPLAHLMQSVFGFHDSDRVRAFCYATTPSDKSTHRQQIEKEAPVFRDVSSWPSEKLVEQIIRDEVHILVNLNGYTRGARNEIFAARPAPIQMSFMGFAGTLGAGWCDYILADTTAIPPETLRPWRQNVSVGDVFRDGTESDEDGWVYSENIIFCRDTFFCCDHAQSCGTTERSMTWAEEQQRRWKMRKELFPTLPDDVIILGNFNQLYKIEPTTFRSWLRILAQVPKAVLWLLRFPELGEENLRCTAKAWAGSEVASRLIFTDVAPKNQHISRARVCDLFLDTPECNAHTTAADVLWSSTPLLTLPRYSYKMCSRMAASILKGALPKSSEGRQIAAELIARSDAEYEQMAIRLVSGLNYDTTSSNYGQGNGRLAEMRKLLWDSKWQCGLFNTRRWVSDVEAAYEEAWRRWVAGEGGDIYL